MEMTTLSENLLASDDGEGKPIDWNRLGFDLYVAGFMLVMRGSVGPDGVFRWGPWEILPYGPVGGISLLCPGINYGVQLLEGLVAFRWEDGSIQVCGPHLNAARQAKGAPRMRLPPVPEDLFVECCLAFARANSRFVPWPGQGRLYIRPVLFAAGRGIAYPNCREYVFGIAGGPAGDYYPEPPRVLMSPGYRRVPLESETWDTKSGVNYGRFLVLKDRARERGYGDILFLDDKDKVTEYTTANLLVQMERPSGEPYLVRPCPTQGTVLPGITSRNLVELASQEGIAVETRPLPVGEFFDRTVAAAAVGTAAVVTMAASHHLQGARERGLRAESVIAHLGRRYRAIQEGRAADTLGIMRRAA